MPDRAASHPLSHPYSRSVLAVAALLVLAVAVFALLRARQDPALLQIEQSKVWRVGTDPSFPPFENIGPDGRPAGLDVDLAQAIAARWGVRAEIMPMGFDQLIDAVAASKVDSAISALPVVDYRRKEVSFSDPYVEAGLVLAVPRGSPIRGTDALAGRRVAAEWGSAGDAEARTLQKALQGKLELVLRETPDAALGAVTAGEADAVLIDAISLALYAGGDLVTAGPPLQSDPYVVVVPARAPQLLQKVNETLAALAADGTLEQLKAKWLR